MVKKEGKKEREMGLEEKELKWKGRENDVRKRDEKKREEMKRNETRVQNFNL